MLGIPRLAEELLASQEGLCFMELVRSFAKTILPRSKQHLDHNITFNYLKVRSNIRSNALQFYFLLEVCRVNIWGQAYPKLGFSLFSLVYPNAKIVPLIRPLKLLSIFVPVRVLLLSCHRTQCSRAITSCVE
jgi:hypothetical protein